jgi:hypothetical protein
MNWSLIMAIFITTSLIPFIAGETVKIYPSDDSFVRAGTWQNTNFQTYQSGSWADRISVGYQGSFDKERGLLKFDLANLTGKNITSAKLSLKKGPILAGSPVIRLYNLSDISWTESGVTWSSIQSSPKTLINSVNVSGLDRVNFTVTSYLNNKSKISFALFEASEGTGIENAVYFYSKDYTTHSPDDNLTWPYLEVTYTSSACETVADTNCNGCVDITEYTNFKYAYKNGLITNVTPTQYNDIKYGFKNGIISC